MVLVDESAPESGPFQQALEWAQRLQVPVLGVSPSAWDFRDGSTSQGNGKQEPPRAARDSGGDAKAVKRWTDVEQDCARACAMRRIPWQLTCWPEAHARGLVRIAGNQDLFMFSRRIPSAHRRRLLRDAFRPDSPATLICADHGATAARALVLDAARRDESLLRTVAEACLSLQLTPVVVSVAGSEKAARQRQQTALDVFADWKAEASFDYLVGCNVAAALTQIASWRRCRLVIGQQHAGAPWWHWLRDTTLEQLVGALDSLSFMVLSEANRWAGPRVDRQSEPVGASGARQPGSLL